MIFSPIGIEGSFLIRPKLFEDERGVFARVWCGQEFAKQGLASHMSEGNASRTARQGTVRGLHYQAPPHAEAKLVRCTKGAIYDVVLDLRSQSPTYRQWRGIELGPRDLEMIYVPEGCAHGYQALLPDTEVSYLVSHPYRPESERGVRYNDPAFDIHWPIEVSLVSPKDAAWPEFSTEEHGSSIS